MGEGRCCAGQEEGKWDVKQLRWVVQSWGCQLVWRGCH
jgi:hypothetical protein